MSDRVGPRTRHDWSCDPQAAVPAGVPTPRAGLIRDGSGAAVGCWISDRFGLLDQDRARHDGIGCTGILHVARRRPGDMWAWRVAHDFGDDGPDPATVGADMDRIPFEAMLWQVRGLSSEPNWMTLVERCRPVAFRMGVKAAALAMAVTTALPRLHATIQPFLDTLDPEARDMPHYGRSWPRPGYLPGIGTYGLLDRTCRPDAPLARALGWCPGLALEAGSFARSSPESFARAVSSGKAGFGGALADRIAAGGLVGRQGACIALRLAGALPTLDDDVAWNLAMGPRALTPFLERLSRHGSPVDLATFLERLPGSWIPRDAAGWTAFEAVMPAVIGAVDDAGDEAASMLDSGGDWAGYSRRLARATGLPEGQGNLRRPLKDLYDMPGAFGEGVVLGAWLSVHGDAAPPAPAAVAAIAQAALFHGRSLPTMLRMSREWHARRATMGAAMPPMSPGARPPAAWPAILPDAVVDGMSLTLLVDAAALADEGSDGDDRSGTAGLAHCVGGYVPHCLAGRCRIVSLRSSDGRRLSTAEVTWADGRATVVQHRGEANGVPGRVAEAALATYVERLGSGVLAATDRCLPTLDPHGDPEARCGYDWRVPGNWEAVRDLWRRWLSRPARRATAAEVAAMVDRVTYGPAWAPIPWSPGPSTPDGRATVPRER